MYKWEDIKKANESIKTTDIKGKDYAEVNQRIKAFRTVCPCGGIVTEMLSNENGICVFKATVINDNGQILGTGTAYEKENSSFINKTSYIENCETSAVGRALGMCGFGIDTSVASYEEVANAIEQQKDGKSDTIKPTKIHIDALKEIAKKKGVTIEQLNKKYNLSKIEDISMGQYAECVKGLNKMPKIE